MKLEPLVLPDILVRLDIPDIQDPQDILELLVLPDILVIPDKPVKPVLLVLPDIPDTPDILEQQVKLDLPALLVRLVIPDRLV